MRRTITALLAFAAFVAFAAFGQDNLSGTYLPKGQGVMDKLEFVSGDTVNVTAMGSTTPTPYSVNGQQVVITVGGQSQPFTIDSNGCLDGGADIGVYCKQ
jgi:hypothetical protein